MDEYTGDQVLRWYERLETSILEYSEHVPLVQTNENLESPFLVSCLMDACGLIDSLFRVLVDSKPINGKPKNKGDYNIDDFRNCFSTKLNLPNMRSILLQAPPRYLIPFSSWAEGLNPSWWKAYNNLKHDRLTSIKEGTLGAALNALCALHQLLARFPKREMFKLLIRQGWLKINSWNPELILQQFEDYGTPTAKFIVQTKLFGAPIGAGNHMNNFHLAEFHTDIQKIDLGSYQNGDKLSQFFCRL